MNFIYFFCEFLQSPNLYIEDKVIRQGLNFNSPAGLNFNFPAGLNFYSPTG